MDILIAVRVCMTAGVLAAVLLVSFAVDGVSCSDGCTDDGPGSGVEGACPLCIGSTAAFVPSVISGPRVSASLVPGVTAVPLFGTSPSLEHPPRA